MLFIRAALTTMILSTPAISWAIVPPHYQDPDKNVSAEIELGMQYNSGNTESSNLNTRGRIIFDTELSRQDAVLRGYFASDGKITSAEQYQLQLQSDVKLENSHYLYGRGDLLWDRFGAYQQQQTYSLGWGYTPIDKKKTSMIFELGLGFRHNKASITDKLRRQNEDEGIVRIASLIEHRLQEYTSVKYELSIETGNRNSIAIQQIGYRNQLLADLAINVTANLKYTNNVPDGTKHNDVLSTVNLLYTLK